MTEQRIVPVVAIWLALFGVWPVAHPTHGDGSAMAMADLILHATGGVILLAHWLANREGERS